MTASSYASTATPPKLEDKQDLGLSLGGDFSDMFAGFGKRKSVVLDVEKNRTMSRSPVSNVPSGLACVTNMTQETLPAAPATRVNRFNSPGHLTIDKNKEIDESPHSWSSQNSHDGLMSNRSPPIIPAIHRKEMPPPVPQHSTSRANTEPHALSSTARPGATSAEGLKRSSALAGKRQSTLEYTPESVDEDARLLRESMVASRKMNDPKFSSKVRDSWALPSSNPTSYKVDDVSVSSWRSGSNETTPKPKPQERQPERQQVRNDDDDNMFDSNIALSANLANRYQEKAAAPSPRPIANRVMTPAQFERYKQDKERLRSIGGQPKEEEDEEEEYDDDEDEAEKAKQLAKLRRKQEAHMAVYRQQMMKVTGETGPRPGMLASHSSPNLVPGKAEEGEEEDEEVPLAILQAHGFPNRNKPPMRSMGSNPNLRASTMTGGGDGGRLPVFARHLPQDPYLGAGLQSPMHRESMAFAGGSASVSGAQRGMQPGGLVGVIATEERSRAMRRGSPNAANSGMYGMPIPGQMGPMGMNPMMMGQGDPSQQQLTQQMQQFMQMQMQFMQMMTSGQSQAPPSQIGPMPGQTSRPSSSHQLRPGSGQPTHQRAMTMMEPNVAPWLQPGGFAPSIHIQGYTPSIAPSERSTVGMPGRYRPVSHMPPPTDNRTRLSTMSGALPNWDNKTVTPAIRVVKKSGNASDEDDEEGWEEMAKKREKKKSMWKSKRDTTNFKDMLHFN